MPDITKRNWNVHFILGNTGHAWHGLNVTYLTIRRQARGFYRLIVGEGRSPEPTIKGDTEPRASRLIVLAYLSDRSMKQKIFLFHKFWYICAMIHAKSRALWQTAVDGTCVANQIARYAIVGHWGMLMSNILLKSHRYIFFPHQWFVLDSLADALLVRPSRSLLYHIPSVLRGFHSFLDRLVRLETLIFNLLCSLWL